MQRVLIANRGAIAVRIMRTLKTMGIESVAVYAEADRQSLHVRHADHAVSLGEGNASVTYLNAARILGIALELKVDAIHPGYGFLSENSEFVRLCEHADIAFIGPTAWQMEAFGLKHRARELAQQQQVPLLPGTDVLADCADALASASAIGYPIMLKSSAGGGGIGMQLCYNDEELRASYSSVSELSKNNFANDALFIEKFVERARHIEVQIFGDGKGQVIALGERDCSAQRRNQKVIEETPAPNLTPATRQSLCEVACRLAAAVNYRNAGTVEFILDADTQLFYFLEVNTRLQVEHGVTEMVFGIDLVQWMVELSAGKNPLPQSLPEPAGHAIQARVYAEDPARDFQPCAGLLSSVTLPVAGAGRRLDHWIESGIEVSALYDPMIAKVIAHANTRAQAMATLDQQLDEFKVYGTETNLGYLRHLLTDNAIASGDCLTSTLKGISYQPQRIEVVRAGTMTTVQDYPGRTGYWPVGIPPSGPFDDVSFRLGNQLLGNNADAAGLEMTLDGPTFRFPCDTKVALTGAKMAATLDGKDAPHGAVISINAGQTLTIGKIQSTGTRGYLLVEGGIDCADYLGSRATFTLGKFGGHAGRALRSGDVLKLFASTNAKHPTHALPSLPFSHHWQIHVIAGPQGSSEFFTDEYLQAFYNENWKVHFNSSRTGVRLIGPKPEWTREDGGEAGMHPSNLHDNAYAFGTVDFTGDMPVILGPDGPSLGGFVCPATVASADRWKLGQLNAGDTLQFISVTYESAVEQLKAQSTAITRLSPLPDLWQKALTAEPFIDTFSMTPVEGDSSLQVKIRRAGDSWLLIEFGDMVLDIELRFVVQRLLDVLDSQQLPGILELTPGIRSLQIHFDCTSVQDTDLISQIKSACQALTGDGKTTIASRIVHLPLSWDDEQCRLAIEKYDQVVRKDAPWYPSNIEFIRRINGLSSIDDVKRTVFDASYLVLGLGDVYLGAPVATPVDPRHRLVTTKYNPARTWTAENSVGIGGSYLCIYGMEGPGGYQFVGRTLQMWNIYHQTAEFEKPWLLRFFDQIKFYPVTEDQLKELRRDFPFGRHTLKIEHTEFNLQDYRQFLSQHNDSIAAFTTARQHAFDAELQRWKETGQYQFEESVSQNEPTSTALQDGMTAVESPAAGSVWKIEVKPGDTVTADQTVLILESMKMEIPVYAGTNGTVSELLCQSGATVEAGTQLLLLTDPPNA
ncbi:MAG: urea carboxylase [Pseudomonadota bacterium]